MPARVAALCGLAAPVVFVVGLGLGLRSALGRGWAARLGSAGLLVVGVGMVLDGFLRLDCQGGIDVPCENLSWHARAHKVESGITGAVLLLTPVVLAFAFRARTSWRSAWVPTLLAVPAIIVASVAWFLWIGFVAVRLWRTTTSPGTPAADTVQA